MIKIKPIELSDKLWVEQLRKMENSRSADFSFGNMYMWDCAYKQKIGRVDNRLIVTPGYCGDPFFAFPIGGGDLEDVINKMHACSSSKGIKFRIRGINPHHRKALEELFPNKFNFFEERRFFDYVYLAEKLASLSGKKLHSKRNHINRFIENNASWRFTPFTTDLTDACIKMLDEWTLGQDLSMEPTLSFEHVAIERGLRNFEALGLEGGVLWLDDRVIGFTIGERISSDTFDIHFEKAFSDIQGAYPIINREFVRQIINNHPDIVYINREDDMGKENLRKAKLSYQPEFLLEKYTAVWADDL